MRLKDPEIKMLRFFCLQLLPDYKSEVFNMPYLNFVFTQSDIEKITSYLRRMEVKNDLVYLDIPIHVKERNISVNKINECIDIIKSTREEYIDNRDPNKIYINIPDYQKFFSSLESIRANFELYYEYNNFNTSALLRTIFLRMGASDINDINLFLTRQLKFIKNDYLFPCNETELLKIMIL